MHHLSSSPLYTRYGWLCIHIIPEMVWFLSFYNRKAFINNNLIYQKHKFKENIVYSLEMKVDRARYAYRYKALTKTALITAETSSMRTTILSDWTS
jgi:hypothetical protein